MKYSKRRKNLKATHNNRNSFRIKRNRKNGGSGVVDWFKQKTHKLDKDTIIRKIKKYNQIIYDNQQLNYLYYNDFEHNNIYRGTILKQLMSLFCCDESYANNVYNNWRASLPVYVRVMNATNDNVIVPLETECNSTAI